MFPTNLIRNFNLNHCKNLLNLSSIRFQHNINQLNIDYLCNPQNKQSISENITRRKGIGNIEEVQNLHKKLEQIDKTNLEFDKIQEKFISEALKIPNESHKDIIEYGNEPKIIKYVGEKRPFDFQPKEFHDLTKHLNLMRTSQLGNVAGTKSYYFFGALAELEQALIKSAVKKLINSKFELMSVPDILPANIIESCGMATKGDRTQVYHLDDEDDLCLSGTSEMAIAGFFKDKIIEEHQLPIKIAAVSRCFRAETSSVAEERGIYRVHQFTKVEMFALTHPKDSDETLESFREFQEKHFDSLGLHFQVLDMPPHELGAPAYRKYDIEAWLPGRNMFGEISSCSNCTDYQSRRLNIKFKSNDGSLGYVHTVNGTACAVPRMLIALLETYQNEDSTISLPDCLDLRFKRIEKEKRVPELKLKKMKQRHLD